MSVCVCTFSQTFLVRLVKKSPYRKIEHHCLHMLRSNPLRMLQHCSINVTGGGYITAQSRSSANDNSGFVFRKCHVLGTGHADLGRAYDAFARVISLNQNLARLLILRDGSFGNKVGMSKFF